MRAKHVKDLLLEWRHGCTVEMDNGTKIQISNRDYVHFDATASIMIVVGQGSHDTYVASVEHITGIVAKRQRRSPEPQSPG